MLPYWGGIHEAHARNASEGSVNLEALVVFNVLYWDAFPAGFGDWWDGQLTGHNVVIDLHLYDCYGDASQKSVDDHMAQAQAWARAIARFQLAGHNVIVGEWSLATGVHPGGQAWATAQLQAFSGGKGWFFWSLKKEGIGDDDGGDTWSLKGVLRAGIRGFAAQHAVSDLLGTAATDEGIEAEVADAQVGDLRVRRGRV